MPRNLLVAAPIKAFASLCVCASLALTADPVPQPWTRSLFDLPPYTAGVDSAVLYISRPSLFIDSAFPPPTQIGPGRFTATYSVVSGVQQSVKADKYKGLRVRWSAYLRTERVRSVWASAHERANLPPLPSETWIDPKVSPGTGLYVFVDSRDKTLLYAMMRDRIQGTNDWTKVEMVFDVPPQSTVISLGFFLAGEGRVWANGFRLEQVDQSIETTLSRDLDLTETQIYEDTFAKHKKRLKQYSNLADAPIFELKKQRK